MSIDSGLALRVDDWLLYFPKKGKRSKGDKLDPLAIASAGDLAGRDILPEFGYMGCCEGEEERSGFDRGSGIVST